MIQVQTQNSTQFSPNKYLVLFDLIQYQHIIIYYV